MPCLCLKCLYRITVVTKLRWGKEAQLSGVESVVVPKYAKIPFIEREACDHLKISKVKRRIEMRGRGRGGGGGGGVRDGGPDKMTSAIS